MYHRRPTVLERLRQLNNAELFLLCQDYRIMVGHITFTNRRQVERLLTVAVIEDRARARVRDQLARERDEEYSRNSYARTQAPQAPPREVQQRRLIPPRLPRDYQRSERHASTMTTPSVHLLSSDRSYWPSAMPYSMRRTRSPPLWPLRFQRPQESSMLERALASIRHANIFGFRVPPALWRYATRGLGYRPRPSARSRGGQGEETIDEWQEQAQEEEEDYRYQLEDNNRYSEESQEQYEERHEAGYENEDQLQCQDLYEENQLQSQDLYEENQQNEEQYQEYGNENEDADVDVDTMPYPGEPSNYGATRYYSHEHHEASRVSVAEQSEDQRQLEWQLNSTYGESRPHLPFTSPQPYDFQELAQLNLLNRQDRMDRIDHLAAAPQNALQHTTMPQIFNESDSDSSEYYSFSSASVTSFHDANEQPMRTLIHAQPVKKRFEWFGWLKVAPRAKGQNERIAKRDQTREQNLEHERELLTINYLSQIDIRAVPEKPLLELMSCHELRHSSEEDANSIGSCGDLQPGILRRTFELLFCEKLRCSLLCCCITVAVCVTYKLMRN